MAPTYFSLLFCEARFLSPNTQSIKLTASISTPELHAVLFKYHREVAYLHHQVRAFTSSASTAPHSTHSERNNVNTPETLSRPQICTILARHPRASAPKLISKNLVHDSHSKTTGSEFTENQIIATDQIFASTASMQGRTGMYRRSEEKSKKKPMILTIQLRP